MSKYEFIKSLPRQSAHMAFDSFLKKIYDAASARFRLGNDPVSLHLEGCYTMYLDKEPVGRFALYDNPDLKYQGENTAAIGSYECIDDLQVSQELLGQAKNILREKGFKWLIGPMEGSTWNNYRFSNHNDHPNFFMEPYHHEYYNQQFIHAGFEVIATYFSNLAESVELDLDRLHLFEKAYSEKGAVFRKMNLNDFKNELRKIAALSLEGFSNNFLYTPITVDEFVSKYEKLAQLFDPALVWMVEDQNGELHAFVFCIKDYNDITNSTLIVKSMVRKRTSPFKEMGSYLSTKSVAMAQEGGFTKVIHALMISDNVSIQLSKKNAGKQYKNYSLYGQKL